MFHLSKLCHMWSLKLKRRKLLHPLQQSLFQGKRPRQGKNLLKLLSPLLRSQKKKGSKGLAKEIGLEKAERIAYEASKKRRKLAISDLEDEEEEDIVKGKKTKLKRIEASLTKESPSKPAITTPVGIQEEVGPSTTEADEASRLIETCWFFLSIICWV